MDGDRLPERRAERRVVFVLDAPAIYALREASDATALRSREDTAIVYAGTDLEATDPITRQLEAQGLLIAGSILVASPYRDGTYATLDRAAERFSLEKWASLSTLCSLLGASSVTVKLVEDTVSSTKVEVHADGGRGPVSAKATGALKRVERFAGALDWHDTFSGGGMDLEAAAACIRDNGLEGDPEIRSLLEARSFSDNLLSRRTVTIDLNRESERTIDAALQIKVPMFLNLGATFKQAAESRAHYKVTIDVDFTTKEDTRR